MAKSFGIVEEKIFETEYFLKKMKECKEKHSFTEIQYYFSAFLSSSRSVTFTLQTSLHDISGFDVWYEQVQEKLRQDQLANFFKKARNDSQKKGTRHINGGRFSSGEASFYFTPWGNKYKFTPEGDIVKAAEEFFKLLLEVLFDCFQAFGEIIDPDKYYSMEALKKRGQTVKDIEYEVWGYHKWTSFGFSEEDTLKYILSNMVKSPMDILFVKYLGKTKEGQPVDEDSKTDS